MLLLVGCAMNGMAQEDDESGDDPIECSLAIDPFECRVTFLDLGETVSCEALDVASEACATSTLGVIEFYTTIRSERIDNNPVPIVNVELANGVFTLDSGATTGFTRSNFARNHIGRSPGVSLYNFMYGNTICQDLGRIVSVGGTIRAFAVDNPNAQETAPRCRNARSNQFFVGSALNGTTTTTTTTTTTIAAATTTEEPVATTTTEEPVAATTTEEPVAATTTVDPILEDPPAITEAPVTLAPSTAAPVSEAPVSEAPTTAAPVEDTSCQVAGDFCGRLKTCCDNLECRRVRRNDRWTRMCF